MKGLYTKRIRHMDSPKKSALYLVESSLKDAVYVHGSFLGGSNFAPKQNPMLPTLSAALLDEGSKHFPKATLQAELDSIGAEVSFSAGGNRLEYELRATRQHLPRALVLLGDMVRNPLFGKKEVEAVRLQELGDIRRRLTDTSVRGREKALLKLYPAFHPNAPIPLEQQATYFEKATREALAAHHSSTLGIASSVHVIGGDVDSKVTKAMHFFLNSIPHASPKPTRIPSVTPQIGSEEKIHIPDKASVDVIVAEKTGITSAHPEYETLRIAMLILAGSLVEGDRLLGVLREKHGLTYHVGSALGGFADQADGYWFAEASFAPENFERGKALLMQEIARFAEKGITEDEARKGRDKSLGRLLVSLSRTKNLVTYVQGLLEDGKSPSYIDERIERISNITRADLNRAIRAYIHPERAVTVSAGSI